MFELLLIRHGQTDWNIDRRIMGHEPIPLNQTGQNQVRLLKERIASIPMDALFHSPHLRTTQSAQILNEDRGLKIQPEEALREIDYGSWVGKTFLEIRQEKDSHHFYNDPHFKVGGFGESMDEVRVRSIKFIDQLKASKQYSRVALVSHADWVKVVMMHYLNIPLSQIYHYRIDNASLTYLVFEEDKARLIAMNLNFDLEKLFVKREMI